MNEKAKLQWQWQKAFRRIGIMRLAVLATSFVSTQALSACNLNVEGVALGSYDFMSGQPLDGVGHVIVACDAATSYQISLSPGNGSIATRLLKNGSHQLTYNLYTDVNRLVVWGDGSSGSNTVSGSASGDGNSDDMAIYARSPAGQNPYVGAYSDAVVVTLVF